MTKKAAALSLSDLSVNELRRTLRAIHRGILISPISRSNLIATGFGDTEAELDALVGLDQKSAITVLSAVLREREHKALVSSAVTYFETRAEALMSLATHAKQSIVVAGNAEDFDFAMALDAARRERDVRVTFYCDAFMQIPSEGRDGVTVHRLEKELRPAMVVADGARFALFPEHDHLPVFVIDSKDDARRLLAAFDSYGQ